MSVVLRPRRKADLPLILAMAGDPHVSRWRDLSEPAAWLADEIAERVGAARRVPARIETDRDGQPRTLEVWVRAVHLR